METNNGEERKISSDLCEMQVGEDEPLMKNPTINQGHDEALMKNGDFNTGRGTTDSEISEFDVKQSGMLRVSLFGKPYEFQKKNVISAVILLVSTIIMVSSRSFDFVLLVRLSGQMNNYSVFLGSILIPLLFNFVYWPVVWFKMFVTKSITKEMRKFPLMKVSRRIDQVVPNHC